MRPRSARCACTGQDGARVALGCVLVVPDQVGQAGLVAGDVLPAVVEVVLVPVGDRHAAKAGQDAELAERLKGPLAQEQQRVALGDRRQHVFLLPSAPAPQRGLIEPGHIRGGDQGLDQLDHIRDHLGRLCQTRVHEARRDLRPGQIRDQPRAPLDRHVLEHDQVDRQGAQVRADRDRRVRHALWPGRDMHLATSAAGLVQVMLDAPRGHQRHLQLLQRPGHAPVHRLSKVRATAIAGPRGPVINHLVGFRPAHRRAPCTRLLTTFAAPAVFAPFPPRRLPARQVISRGRHRGVAAVAAQPAPQLRDLGPKFPDRPAKLRDHLIPGGACHAPCTGRWQIAHKPP